MHIKSSQMFMPLSVASHNAVTLDVKNITNVKLVEHQILLLILSNCEITYNNIKSIQENLIKLFKRGEKWRIVLMQAAFKKDDL